MRAWAPCSRQRDEELYSHYALTLKHVCRKRNSPCCRKRSRRKLKRIRSWHVRAARRRDAGGIEQLEEPKWKEIEHDNLLGWRVCPVHRRNMGFPQQWKLRCPPLLCRSPRPWISVSLWHCLEKVAKWSHPFSSPTIMAYWLDAHIETGSARG